MSVKFQKFNILISQVLIGAFIVFFIPTQVVSEEKKKSSIENKPALYIKSLKAKVYVKPSSSSKVVTELLKGDNVYAVKSQGVWTKVKFDESNSGWIYKMLLSKTLPKKRINILEKGRKIKKSQRARASLYSGTAAARGLSDSSKELNEKYPPNNAELKKMEMFAVDKSKAIKFIIGGRIK